MKKYYVADTGGRFVDLVRLGEKIKDSHNGLSFYYVDEILIGEYTDIWKDISISVELDEIVKFKNNEEALLWFKLNYGG